ncbi:fumarylacetoacetate (FAA) hydrolase [Sphingopyxis alaskensis RB2256]|uniref:Fumarylacetoacetate (FAA) hydrolase n=1 Tax=Sphingopyxis alaskensis (strain DSM 13593 / LMG 18877 / RB2256) TaxID=317655 RepID=Q1GRD3_SPHAL|nr:fumarylacetoacetate (FAA) hydrolase [Sphingopyxis alaskensis RB2256]
MDRTARARDPDGLGPLHQSRAADGDQCLPAPSAAVAMSWNAAVGALSTMTSDRATSSPMSTIGTGFCSAAMAACARDYPTSSCRSSRGTSLVRRRTSSNMPRRCRPGLPPRRKSDPYIFLKTVESVVGPGDTVAVPPQVERPDWEVELGVAIGKAGKNVAVADAHALIAGYTVVNDVSARDRTRRSDFPLFMNRLPVFRRSSNSGQAI